MTDAVGAVDLLSDTIVGAVRAQSAAGRVISANVADAGVAAELIGANAADIMAGAQAASEDAEEMRTLAITLSRRATLLEGHLRAFLTTLQAA